jgi:hypothetical protein
VRRPVVELMLVSERTRVGCSTAIVCAIMPPIDTPTRCADSRPRWSSSATASPARSDIVYGVRARPVAKARTSWSRRTGAATRDDRPVSRLS